MLRTWLEPEENSAPDEYVRAIGGNPLVSQVLYARGVKDIQSAQGFLSPTAYHPSPPGEIPGLTTAVDLLIQAVSAQKKIGVWGDFDVDGQTSTTVLVSALRQAGANVIYHIPVRSEESHGIQLGALRKFLQQGADLIVTCDTGISSHAAIEYAAQNGVLVIVTDHHDLPEVLPKASAIVNPKFLPPQHPLANLPGVGVAFKIVESLVENAGEPTNTGQYLDLVSLGLVADIALLRDDNRYLLQLGLEALRKSQRTGLLAMMELAELVQANLTEEHIAYVLAPRMNALGRLDDANSMVELLTTTDMGRARLLALELEGMNAQRKLLSDQVYQAAQAQINAEPKYLEYPVLVLSHPSWPAGVIGVVASRLVEQCHRPVILISSPAGQDARGSARSIEGINITAAIAANSAMLKNYGGHPMAAGLAMDPANIEEFRKAISRTVEAMGVEVRLEKELQVDGYISLPELSLELVEDLERLAPFGAGNPPLVFATRNLKLTGYAAVGRSGEHLQLTLEDELGHTQRSIWWQGAGYPLPEGRFDLAYAVRTSTYRGQRELQLEWIDYRQQEDQLSIKAGKEHIIEVVDFRDEADPITRLKALQGQEKLLVWAEGEARQSIPSADRNMLSPMETLAILSIPPGPHELWAALQRANPKKVYLFALNPGMDEAENFLKRLVGLSKSCIRLHQGVTSLPALAAATAQRIQVVKAGLDWLDSHGYIQLLSINSDEVKMGRGPGKRKPVSSQSSARLNTQLAESAAYRRYFLSAQAEQLVHLDEDA